MSYLTFFTCLFHLTPYTFRLSSFPWILYKVTNLLLRIISIFLFHCLVPEEICGHRMIYHDIHLRSCVACWAHRNGPEAELRKLTGPLSYDRWDWSGFWFPLLTSQTHRPPKLIFFVKITWFLLFLSLI